MDFRIINAFTLSLLFFFSLRLTDIELIPAILRSSRPLHKPTPTPPTHARTKSQSPPSNNILALNRRRVKAPDSKTFLALLKQQGGPDLFYCLKASPLKSPLFLSATLTHQGHLRTIHRIQARGETSLPECLNALLEGMNFSKLLVEPLRAQGIEIQWSLEF